MIKQDYWQFEQIERIEELFFNKSLEKFYEYGIGGIVRENIQNSLDARLDKDKPIIVKIKTGKIEKEKIPGIDEISYHIEHLKGGNEYTKETIDHMQRKIKENELTYISFEDEQTKGLTGAEKGELGSLQDTWSVYAYKKGVHAIDDNIVHESTRGGSHGIGKIASNAGSDVHMMFFANCDANGQQHIGGTVQLIEHQIGNKSFRSTGYFSNVINGKYYPFTNDFDQDVFGKTTRGLKIIIPFLREGYAQEKEIIKSVCDSFFLSIIENNLIVYVNEHILKKDTIEQYILNQEYFEQEIEKIKKEFTPLYYQTYMQEEPFKINVSSLDNDYEFDVYFNYNERIPSGRVAIIRTIGMKIEDLKVKNNVRKPFNAVLIGGMKEDQYLKTLENESHTKIDHEHIKDKRLKRSAKRFINNLSREFAKIIDAKMKELNPSDGVLDTTDTIYLVENEFKKKLEDSITQVNISEGKKLILSGRGSIKEERDKGDGKNRGPSKNTYTRDRKPTKKQPGDRFESKGDNGNSLETYKVNSAFVKRITIANNEKLFIDLSMVDNINEIKSCHLKMIAIDGMGKECKESEFHMDKMYEKIYCTQNRKELYVKSNKLLDVPVQEGKISLDLEWNNDANKMFKLVYYIEV